MTVPSKYAGQVIAWDSPQRARIVGSGRGAREARTAAKQAGVDEPFLERVPRHDRTFIAVTE